MLSRLIKLIDEKIISYGIAEKKVFPALMKDPQLDMEAFIKQQDLATTSSSTELDNLVMAALTKHSQKIGEYKKGKKGLISLFVGEVMKLSNGKADAKLVTQKITEKLNAS